MKTEEQRQSRYRSRVSEQLLKQAPPEQKMPTRVDNSEWELDAHQGLSLKLITLLLGIVSLLAFAVFDAVDSLMARFDASPVSASLLAVLLGGFVISLLALIVREWLGFKAVGTYVEDRLNISKLDEDDNASKTREVLQKHGNRFGSDSYAARCYRHFDNALTLDMSNREMIDLYHRTVATPVTQKADEVLRRESVTSGTLTFISPNHLIQTLVILWISTRTIRRVARVFGLRPGSAGSWRLFKVLAQNLAAQSLFDIATDEVANQISGSLAAKFMENSAEAVAAGALNVRLGKVLIRLLR